MEPLTDGLLKMRSRLRDENEKIMRELQHDAAQRIDRDIHERLASYQELIDKKKSEISKITLQALHERLCQLSQSHDEYSSLRPIFISENYEIPSLLTAPPHKQEITSIATRLLQTLLVSLHSYQMTQLDEARQPFESLQEDLESSGQRHWEACLSEAKEEWAEMGVKRLAIEESYKDLAENEENTLVAYINDQVRDRALSVRAHPLPRPAVGSRV
jgi:hypothetical protein